MITVHHDLDYSEIGHHIFLSNVFTANNTELLTELDIKYVLSVFNDQLTRRINTITYKLIYADDTETEDLITNFPETNEFIASAQQSGHNVLVHCHAGVSRSSTVVIAFLMHKDRISFTNAYHMVKQYRDVAPNPGFVSQLQLYEHMEWRLDANNRRLRQILVERHINYDRRLSQSDQHIEKYFAKRDFIEKQTPNFHSGSPYLCANCGKQLFEEIHMIGNEVFDKRKKLCRWTYIEPQKWMRQSLDPKIKQWVNCWHCSQSVIEYKKHYQKYCCQCPLHNSIGIDYECLRFRIATNKFSKHT